jgi:hypothetical protein
MRLTFAAVALFAALGAPSPALAQQRPRLEHATLFGPDIAWVRKDPKKRWLCVDTQGRVLGKMKHWTDEVGLPGNGLAPSRLHHGGWGFVDRTGHLVLPAVYDHCNSFVDNHAWVVFEGKYGCINLEGNFVVPPIYYSAQDYSEGVAAVWNDTAWGFVDLRGRLVIPHKFAGVRPFTNGLAAAMDRVAWGVIDSSGKYVVEPRFSFVGDFGPEGLALASLFTVDTVYVPDSIFERVPADSIVWQYPTREVHTDPNAQATPPDSVPYFRHGNTLVPIHNHAFGRFYHLKRVDMMRQVRLSADSLLGFIGRNGEFAIPPTYPGLRPFSQGLAAFRSDSLWGYLNPQGQVAIAPKYQAVEEFAEGLAPAAQNGKWGYIDTRGEFVIPPRYEVAEGFNNGLARVTLGGLVGFINPQGTLVVGGNRP